MATIAIFGGAKGAYCYEAFGQRFTLKGTGTPYQIQVNDLNGHLLTETSAAATPVETDYVTMDGRPIAAIQPAAATVSALHTDNIGTVQKATDSTKAQNWVCNYRPFGACTPTTTITINLRLPGTIADPTGLYHWGFRDLSTTFGRGMQPDPLGLAASFPGYPVATVNGYPYALNNPITNTDRLGLCLEDACIGEAIIATEAVEALSAGVADVLEALEAGGEAAEGTLPGAVPRESSAKPR